ncbi:serine/threonine-protein kinase [Thermococcus sp.]|uniref:protein kinase domain-containing protein n=1 Tax=Thermococcus sp. TaxID=35749 RepID=UPI00261F33C0|nr:serine/threonine-protein kinase [Thermococcus sp.]
MTFPRELLSKYKEPEFIGEGIGTSVYKVKRRKDNKPVAVKIFDFDLEDKAMRNSFLKEIENWVRLAHPNIAEVHDYSVLPVPYVEMEYYTESLAHLLVPLDILDASLVAFDIAEGLKYAHSRGIIHGNLKPSNIFLKEGVPKISDWIKITLKVSTVRTTPILNIYHLAPENIRPDKYGYSDHRTDIWQLGVIFYRLLTGKTPFEGSLSEFIGNVVDESYQITPPSKIDPKLVEYDRLFEKLLARRKEDRYQNIEEFQRDLVRTIEGVHQQRLRESGKISDLIKHVHEYSVSLILMHMKLQDTRGALLYSTDLLSYTKGSINEEIQGIIDNLDSIMKNGDRIPLELIQRVETLLHKVRSQKSKKLHFLNVYSGSLQEDIQLPSRRDMASSQERRPEGSIVQPSTSKRLDIPRGFPEELLELYTNVELLGKGGFARVYKAKRKTDEKVVALKIPRIDERTSSLFIKEVAAWYNLNHKNIVRLYKADILPIPYLEMEFVEGVEIDGKLVRDLDAYPKPLDEKIALKFIEGIASGLAHAHSKGIYHLDLKPLNVLLKSDLTPKITDWGLAKISARSSLSQHYGYSPLYAAPEQLDEETFGMPDHRTDIYQLGLIFYELLTGELPYKATSPGALVGKILYSKPKPVSEIKPELKKFDGVFEKLLAKRKEDRYQSVDEFLSALESLGKLKREKEDLTKTTLAMKRSKSREEFERLKIKSIRQTVAIAVLSAKLNDKALLLEALDDLRFHTRENFEDLVNLIAQVEMLTREGIPISGSLAEKIEVLVRRIEGEALR